MKFWKSLFGDPDTVREIVTGAKAGIDMAIYTEEERAIAAEDEREFRLRYMEATNPQNVARRVIAFLIVGLWVALVLLAVATRGLSVAYSDFVFRVLQEVVNTPFGMVMGFYYLAHLVRSAKKPR